MLRKAMTAGSDTECTCNPDGSEATSFHTVLSSSGFSDQFVSWFRESRIGRGYRLHKMARFNSAMANMKFASNEALVDEVVERVFDTGNRNAGIADLAGYVGCDLLTPHRTLVGLVRSTNDS